MADAPPLQLASFHSTSKGFLGECGLRGGYFELTGFDAAVKGELLKLVSIGLCSNTLGQLATGLMVRPPRRGDASHAEYVGERDAILSSLKRRAKTLVGTRASSAALACRVPVACRLTPGASAVRWVRSTGWRASRATRRRARCTRSPRSRCRPRPSPPPRPRAKCPTVSRCGPNARACPEAQPRERCLPLLLR